MFSGNRTNRAIDASFCLLGVHTLLMGLLCGIAALCRRLGWLDASASLTRTALDMLLAAIIALAVLLVLEKSMKQPTPKDSHRFRNWTEKL